MARGYLHTCLPLGPCKAGIQLSGSTDIWAELSGTSPARAGSFAKPRHTEISLGSSLVALCSVEVVFLRGQHRLGSPCSPTETWHGAHQQSLPVGTRPFSFIQLAKSLLCPVRPGLWLRPGQCGGTDLYLNPTRNMSVPGGRRQKKCWFNFCSKGQSKEVPSFPGCPRCWFLHALGSNSSFWRRVFSPATSAGVMRGARWVGRRSPRCVLPAGDCTAVGLRCESSTCPVCGTRPASQQTSTRPRCCLMLVCLFFYT